MKKVIPIILKMKKLEWVYLKGLHFIHLNARSLIPKMFFHLFNIIKDIFEYIQRSQEYLFFLKILQQGDLQHLQCFLFALATHSAC